MYPTHAAILDVSPLEDKGAARHIAAVRAAVETWIETEIRGDGNSVNTHDTSRDSTLRTVGLSGPEGHNGEMREAGSPPAGDWAWAGWVERLLPPIATCSVPRTLRTDIQMRARPATHDGSLCVMITLQEQLAFPSGGRAPSRQAEIAPPSTLLDALLGQFRVFQGSIEWTRSYWTVSTPGQIDQLFERIVDPTRTVPLLICVGDEHQGPPMDPAELGRALFGTARVVHISRPRLTGLLRERIGEKHRVGWNVIRLFRPGYSPADSGGVHRFFRKPEIDNFTGTAFVDWLSHYIRREESWLIAPDSVVRERMRASERRQANAARAAVESALASLGPQMGDVEHDSLADAIALLIGDLATAQDRLAEAELLAESYADELDQARDEAFRLKSHITTLEGHLRGVSQSGLPIEVMSEPTTVREAVDHVLASMSDDAMVIQDRVLKHLERQRLAVDPIEVRDMLLTIHDVARQCRNGVGNGRSPAEYFRDKGIPYKMDISETARQQYAADYAIEIERNGVSERVLMGPHVDLSIRHRIYWFHDKEAQQFVIGHIGDHLRDASTN